MSRRRTDDEVERPARIALRRRLAPVPEKVETKRISSLHELRELMHCERSRGSERERFGNDRLYGGQIANRSVRDSR